MMKYRIAERFISINGEGRRAGELALFIRFTGCNLKCSYCDTAWANQEDAAGDTMTRDQILQYVEKMGIKNVTLTGGEPLLQPQLQGLLEGLGRIPGIRTEIETNGSLPIREISQAFLPEKVALTMDYKLAGSGMEHQMLHENFPYLRSQDTVKFVVAGTADLNRAYQLIHINQLLDRCAVHFSPVFGKISLEKIVMFMKDHQLQGVRLQPQLHKFIWHPETRGV